MYRFYKSDKNADVKMLLRDSQIPAHKIVICSQSKMIEAMLNGRFVESTTNEVPLQNEEPHLIERMIEFMYKGDYTHFKAKDEENKYAMSISSHVDMYSTAKYFQIEALAELAKQKYSRAIAKTCTDHPDFFLESIAYIYYKTPDHLHDLRSIATSLAKEHRQVFARNAETRARFESICLTTPEFFHEIMQDWFTMNPRPSSQPSAKPSHHCRHTHTDIHRGIPAGFM